MSKEKVIKSVKELKNTKIMKEWYNKRWLKCLEDNNHLNREIKNWLMFIGD